jgi:drug/metabolite transporter (DMT)-like permease
MRIVLGFVLMIACTAVGNILMKLGALTPIGERAIFGVVAWQSCLGVAIFAASVIIYALLLQWVPLNVAQSFAAFQFVAVIVASAWLLGEPMSPARWFGIVLIVAGILAVGMSGGIVESVTGDSTSLTALDRRDS